MWLNIPSGSVVYPIVQMGNGLRREAIVCGFRRVLQAKVSRNPLFKLLLRGHWYNSCVCAASRFNQWVVVTKVAHPA